MIETLENENYTPTLLANKLNKIEDINNLFIPVLNDTKVINNEDLNSPNIFIAVGDGIVEQLNIVGKVSEEVLLEDMINNTITEIKEYLKKDKMYSADKEYIKYYRDYDNQEFDFKIYAQDVLTGTPDNIMFIRQLNAYFVDYKINKMYQLSIASGPHDTKDYKLLNDINNIEEDIVTKPLDKILNTIMDNLKYNN